MSTKNLDKIYSKSVTIRMTAKKDQKGSNVTECIPFIDVINWQDPTTGMMSERKIRYIPGSTSIFADEQPKDYDSKWEKTEMRPKSLRVINGTYIVDHTEVLLMQYIRLCNFNASNPSRKTKNTPIFEIFNPEAIAQKANEDRDLRIKAEGTVQNMQEHELRAHIIVLSTDGTINSLNRFRAMEVEQLRYIAYDMATADPKKFLDTFKAPQTKNKYIVINALLRNIINYNEQTQVLSWSNGDAIQMPSNGMNGVDALSELATTSAHHKAIIDDLYGRMTTTLTQGEKKIGEPTEVKVEVKKDMYETLIDQCIAANIISKSGFWLLVNNKADAPADQKPIKANGNKSFIELMKADGKKLYLELLERLETVEA